MKVPPSVFWFFFMNRYTLAGGTLMLADCLEIAFTSKDGFCIPAVIGPPESIPCLRAVKCGPSLV